jgi:cardiolipin synthase A/B
VSQLLLEHWRLLLSAVALGIDIAASLHALLNKRDYRSAITWIGFIWLVPVVGSVLYIYLGINRVQRRARKLHGRHVSRLTTRRGGSRRPADVVTMSAGAPGLKDLAHLVGTVTGRPLELGNAVEPLVNGDEAYPRMLAAIETAKRSVALSTYIFDNDQTGKRFADVLEAAANRNIPVRVLIDDVGARYSFPSIVRRLRRSKVLVARFMPTNNPWRFPFPNLRNHRKLLVVDGTTAFTGGLNIRDGHVLGCHPQSPVADLHFCLQGPVVAQIQEVFAGDWQFCTDETLDGDAWFPLLDSHGDVSARVISHGPDDDFEILKTIFLGALSCASHRVVIATPYFLPDASLVAALNVAALRGVQVDIVLPKHCNLPPVQWASTAQLWQVLEHGCRVWWTPPPFDHTKLLLVDGVWSLIGSANWDPRSLRLNFEFDVECYDPNLCRGLEKRVDAQIAIARRVTLQDVDGRPILLKLRDGLAHLLTPYL